MFKKFLQKSPLALFFYLCIFSCALGLSYRVLFVVYHFHSHFRELDFSEILRALFFGLRFDISFAAYLAMNLTILYFLWPKKYRFSWKYLSIAILLFQSAVLISDLMYFTESSRHLSYEMNQMLSDSSLSLFLTAWSQHTKVLLVSCLFQILIYFLFFKSISFFHLKINSNSFLQLLLCLPFFVLAARGGLQMVPLKPEFSHQLTKPKLSAIALNGAYSALYESFHARKLSPLDLPPAKENELILGLKEFYSFFKFPTEKRILKKRNVVVFLLEGWPAIAMSTYGNPLPTTPNFTNIRNKSLTVPMMLAGGRRTTEGIFNIFCSFPNPLGKTIAQSQLQNFEYQCAPQILEELGWTTAFFQGSLKETSSTGSFAQKTGFVFSFGRDDIDFNKRGWNTWGAHDDDLLDFVFEKSKTLKQPFFLGINTNSTHDHQSPKDFVNLFDTKDDHLQRLNVLNYADEALGRFVDKFLARYPNSLLVFVADHTSFINSSLFEQFAVPFAFYAKDIPAKVVPTIASQKDIAPTIFDYLNVPFKKYTNFSGVSLLKNEKSFADIYHEGQFGWAYGLNYFEYNFASDDIKSFLFDRDTQSLVEANNPTEESQIPFAKFFVRKTQQLLFEGKTQEFKAH